MSAERQSELEIVGNVRIVSPPASTRELSSNSRALLLAATGEEEKEETAATAPPRRPPRPSPLVVVVVSFLGGVLSPLAHSNREEKRGGLDGGALWKGLSSDSGSGSSDSGGGCRPSAARVAGERSARERERQGPKGEAPGTR